MPKPETSGNRPLSIRPRLNRCARVVNFQLTALAFCLSLSFGNADAAPSDATSGTIVYTRGDEYLLRAGASTWEKALFRAELGAGDEVRTGPYGMLAIVLRDETQVRLHRNSRFVIAAVRDGESIATTQLELLSGAMWSRAKSLSRTVTVLIGVEY